MGTYALPQSQESMVREVCEAFRKNVKPKLHLLPKQIIAGDPNSTNLVFASRNKHFSQYSVQDIAFIDLAWTLKLQLYSI